MVLKNLQILVFILFGLSLVSAQLPFGFNPRKIFGYDLLPKPAASETECKTDNDRHPGTCMSRKECNQLSGTASGSCAGSEVCCEISMACGKVSRAKKTVIRSPSHIPDQCTYYFRPYSKYVCQLRIDFSMKLGTPSIPKRNLGTDGSYVHCDETYIKFGKQIKLCGVDRKQHVYLTFNAERDQNTELPITIIHKEAQNAGSDYWDIVVTQIECPPKEVYSENDQLWSWKVDRKLRFDQDLIAPEGCLQYFIEDSGTFESFNYNNGNGPYLGDMRYGVCFRRKHGDRSIIFEATKFNLNSNRYNRLDTNLNCFDPLNPRSNKDYLLIPDSYLRTPSGVFPGIRAEASKYCGTILEGRELYYSPAGPFVVTVNFDRRYSRYNRMAVMSLGLEEASDGES
ncbi:unnamed protein product [Hermetia illucens]|uniref:CUB domain-containing protein n=1 Tax=Hermetia illucens TaxID=343691 RepID=A0A7R8UBI5_HERIL|nr:unnamed protein product [Hermetia illucens]